MRKIQINIATETIAGYYYRLHNLFACNIFLQDFVSTLLLEKILAA